MKYWQIVGASKSLDGDTLDTMLWDHRERKFKRDRGDDGECTSIYDYAVLRENYKMARQEQKPLFEVHIVKLECDDAS